MKRLIFSDIHFHPFSYCTETTEDGFNSRLVNQYQAAYEMLQDIEKFNVQYCYFCGDLFHQHSNIPIQALTLASDLFKQIRKYGTKLRFIAGNHDQYTRSGNIHALEFLPDEEISGHWNDEGLEVYGLSYTKDEEKFKRFLEKMGEGDQKMILLHQGVAGVPLSSGYVVDDILTPGMIPDNVRAFTGHYHFYKQISSNLIVVGNLTPLNFSDIDQKKGWLIWDDETNEIKQRVQQSASNFISWNAEKDTDLSLLENNFVRYISSVKAKDCDEIRKQLIKKGARSVEFSNVELDEKQNILRSKEKITVNSIIKNFDEQCSGRRKEVGQEIRENQYNVL